MKIKFVVVDRLFFNNIRRLVALGTLSRRLLACLNFALDKKDLPYKKEIVKSYDSSKSS